MLKRYPRIQYRPADELIESIHPIRKNAPRGWLQGWKKAKLFSKSGISRDVVIRLSISKSASVVSSGYGEVRERKYRASRVRVMEIIEVVRWHGGTGVQQANRYRWRLGTRRFKEAYTNPQRYYPTSASRAPEGRTYYRVGGEVLPHAIDLYPGAVCGPGIHFFRNKTAAVRWPM